MNPWPDIERAICEATGAPFLIESRAGVAGGCINDGHVVRGGGRTYFVKLNAADRAPMFAAEAAGLEELRGANAVRVPRPVCHGAGAAASWIVLEHLELAPADGQAMRVLGLDLARLHRASSPRYGWKCDNTIGSTPQPNSTAEDWVEFWRERRLGFQLKLAESRGHAGPVIENGRRLIEKLPAFFAGYRPAPSLLHGDLWAGNAAMTTGGEPVIYDPAVYFGDREADLAMTELFGGFTAAFYDAYRSDYPLDAGYSARRTLYNLYHVLNHWNLFGGGYGAQAGRMIGELLAQA
jgi:protein-ribulosamine 3-kinase